MFVWSSSVVVQWMSGVASGVAREQLPIWDTIPNMQHVSERVSERASE